MSVGLNKNFAMNMRDSSLQPEEQEVSRTVKKANARLTSDQLLENHDREGSNSQRSFRIRKGYIRSISRGSNVSKASNLTHDAAKMKARTLDPN